MRVVVVGARGQLGAAIVDACAARYEVTAYDRAALDMTNGDAVAAVMDRSKPNVIINCSGYNAVDAAEDHPVDALQVNAFAVRSLARAARTGGATLVHYSSDFVFDGTGSTPHVETDAPNPQSVYASSKLLGEWFASDAPRWYVLRVESLFGAAPGTEKGSVAAIVAALRKGERPRVFEDRTVSPTYIPDAVRATCALIERDAPDGVYHCVNSGWCTWLEFAREAARVLGLRAEFDVVRVADVKLKAPRPQYCAMSNQKLAAAIGIPMPTWQDALARYLSGSGL
jgi:dTDP-4-dehydrorhamnose reductase